MLRDSDFEATAYSDAHDWIRWVNEVVAARLTPSEVVAQFTAMNPGAGEPDARQALADVAPTDPRATAAFVENQVFEDFDIENTLDRMVCAALLLAGNLELGSLIRDEDLDFFTAHAAYARARRIPSGGHGLLWDEPARIVRTEVADFLATMQSLVRTAELRPDADPARRHAVLSRVKLTATGGCDTAVTKTPVAAIALFYLIGYIAGNVML